MSGGIDLAAYGLIAAGRRPVIPGEAPRSVADVLARGLREAPDEEALVGRHARFTWAGLDREVDRAAHALLGAGIGPGDRLAASLGNHTEIAVAFLAAMRIGAIWVGVSHALAPPEKLYVLRDAGARLLLADAATGDQLAPLRAELPDLEREVRVEPGSADCGWRALVAGAADETRPALEIDPFAPAAIAYTSGTTGQPKGAVHSQHGMLLPGAVAAWQGRTHPGVILGVCLPLTVLNLMTLGPVFTAQSRSRLVLMDRIDALGIAAWVRQERVAAFTGVPTILHDLLTHPDVRPEDLSSLTHPAVGGASCPEEFKQLYRERFGREVREGYGMTEAPTSVTSTDPDGPPVPGSVGRALPHVRLRVEDDSGAVLGPDEVGEICVGGTDEGEWAGVYIPMLGYWKRAEATAEALRGGWLHTGDLGRIDADGNVFIVDRKTDMIVRGGSNVYSAEVERVLHEDERVAECAVLGIPDRRLGERVVAAVRLEKAGASAPENLEAELREHCLRQIARYKCPDRIVIVDEFPRNAMNKIVKPRLRELFAD